MREINFRLWDKRHKKMIYNIQSINFDTEDYLPFSVLLPSASRESRLVNDTWIEEDGTYVDNKNKEAELMQYTGLKDKNGNGIYEGDIIKFKHDDYTVPFTQYIKFVGGTYQTDDYHFYLHEISHYVEIIGNIYENPELLETMTK